MKYVGGKTKIVSQLTSYLNMYRRGRPFVDIFCGGCAVVENMLGVRYANDIDVNLIAIHLAIQQGWMPPVQVTELQYMVMLDKPYPPQDLFERADYAFIGFCCSFSGKWKGGYARGGGRDFAYEAHKNILATASKLKDVVFSSVSYKDFVLVEQSLIYCDPPYRDVTGYQHKIDHDSFYQWCSDKRKDGHTVIVSEYSMPEGFKELASFDVSSNLDVSGSKRNKEKIFLTL